MATIVYDDGEIWTREIADDARCPVPALGATRVLVLPDGTVVHARCAQHGILHTESGGNRRSCRWEVVGPAYIDAAGIGHPGEAPLTPGDHVTEDQAPLGPYDHVPEDHTDGRVVAVYGDQVEVAWSNGTRTTQSADLLRKL